MYCKNCGNKLDSNSKFCSSCGFENNIQSIEQKNIEKNKNEKNKWLWIILIIPVVSFLIYGAIVFIDMSRNMMSDFSDFMGFDERYDINEFVNYMNEKYTDDTFTYKNITGGHLGSNTKKVLVESQKYPRKPITVIRTREDGNYDYTDTYLGVKFEEQTRTYLKNKLSEKFGNKVYVDYIADDLACTSNGSSYTTFEEYIANEYSHIFFEAIIGCDVNDNTKDAILNKIKDAFSSATILANIYFVDENIASSNYDTYDEFTSYIQNKQYNKKLFLIKENVNEYSKLEWSNK